MINEGKQGGMEQLRHEESLVQAMEEMFGDTDVGRDKLKKLLENELVMNDLRAKRKITRM